MLLVPGPAGTRCSCEISIGIGRPVFAATTRPKHEWELVARHDAFVVPSGSAMLLLRLRDWSQSTDLVPEGAR